MDTVSTETRSRMMRAVRSKNTKPEVLLRRTLWGMGIRGYRIHRTDIFGQPDLSFIGKKIAVFVDGAFWHGHPDKYWQGRSGEYWDKKIARNIERDEEVNAALESQGWAVVRVWDFEVLNNPGEAADKVKQLVTRQRK